MALKKCSLFAKIKTSPATNIESAVSDYQILEIVEARITELVKYQLS